MRWADSNPSVLTWASECLHIPYYLATDGKWHRYFPDFLLKIKSSDGTPKTWLVEIKPESQTRHPQTKRYGSSRRQLKESLEYAKNQAKWTAATIYCNDKGWKFMILTERDLFQKLPNGK